METTTVNNNVLEVKITRTLNNLAFTFNGEQPGHLLSRQLTGTTEEGGNGIFSVGKISFHVGGFNKEFIIPYMPPKGTLDKAKEYVHELVAVIKDIRAWVAECKASDGELNLTIIL